MSVYSWLTPDPKGSDTAPVNTTPTMKRRETNMTNTRNNPPTIPPKKKARVRDIDNPQGEDRDEMLRGFGFDPDNPNDPHSGGQ